MSKSYRQEKERLLMEDPSLLVESIKHYIEIIINTKEKILGPQVEYESLVRDLEAEIRDHIRTQEQYKLQLEVVNEKLDECEILKTEIKHLNEVLVFAKCYRS